MKACLLVMALAATAVAAPKKNIAEIYAVAHGGEKPPKSAKVDNANGWLQIASKGNPTETYALWVTDDGRYLLGMSTLEGHAGGWWWSDGITAKDAEDVFPKVTLSMLWPKQLSAKDRKFADGEADGDVPLILALPRKGTTIHATLSIEELFGGDDAKLSVGRRLLPKQIDFKWDKAAGKFTR